MTHAALRLLSAVSLLAATCLFAPSAHADVEITEAARRHFSAGVALLRDAGGPRYEEAFRSFKAAYREAPSWKILGNLGLCAMKLERDSEAIDYYTRYLDEGAKIGKKERKQIESDLAILKSGKVDLQLDVVPTGATVVDTRTPIKGPKVINRYEASDSTLAVAVRAGSHQLRIELEGYEPATQSFEAAAGEVVKRAITLTPINMDPEPEPEPEPAPPPSAPAPAEEPDRPLGTGFYVALAATGAFAVGAGVMGGVSLSNLSDYDAAYDSGDFATAADLRDTGQTLNIVTDVLIGGAVAAAGVTAVLFFVRPEPDDEAAAAAKLDVAPVLGMRQAGIRVIGSM
jgi:tetratricopeptide (TPR) repeat protein